MSIYAQRLNLIIHRCNDQSDIDEAIRFHRLHPEVMMECDVRMTADRVLVAHHSYFFQYRKLNRQHFAQLGGRLLSLDEVLGRVAPLGLRLHLDVKVQKNHGHWEADADADLLFGLLQSHGMADKVIISNIKGWFLRRLRALSPSLSLGILYDESYGYLKPNSHGEVQAFISHILATHQEINISAVFFNRHWLRLFDKHFHMLDKLFYTLVKAGIKVAVWTVNSPQTAALLARHGAHWITTDKPEHLHAMLVNPSVQDVTPLMSSPERHPQK